jgi:hypothetical protein
VAAVCCQRYILRVLKAYRMKTTKGELAMIELNEVDETVPASHPEIRRVLGIGQCKDPDQAARRMVRCGVPHLRIGCRIRFSIPALRRWAAAKINGSVAASAVTQNDEAQDRGVSLVVTP